MCFANIQDDWKTGRLGISLSNSNSLLLRQFYSKHKHSYKLEIYDSSISILPSRESEHMQHYFSKRILFYARFSGAFHLYLYYVKSQTSPMFACLYVCTVQHRHVFNRNRCSNYSTLCKGKWRAFSWKWEVENVLMRLHFDLVSYTQKQMHTFQSRNIFRTHHVHCHFYCSGQTT